MKRAAAIVAALAACSEQQAPVTSIVELPGGVVARVGSEDIAADTVVRIAAAQRISLEAARSRAVSDALFATAVRDEPGKRATVAATERAVLGRMLLESLRAQVTREGPVTEEELAALVAERWHEFDRPPSVRVVHAVVLVNEPARADAAKALAERLAEALRGAKDANDFLQRAQAFPKQGFDVRAEQLPAVTTDNRLWDPQALPPAALTGSFDADFTRAAHALASPGDHSPVTKTSFGYHVIRLQERYPERRLTPAERQAELGAEALGRRVKRELGALLGRLRGETPVSIERAADELTASIPVAP